MSRAQDRPAGMPPTGAQGSQQGATGPGTTRGAGATGTAGTTGNTGTTTTGLREDSMHEQSATSASYERGPARSADYREARGGTGTGIGAMRGGVLSVVAGLLTFLAGLAAIIRTSFYPVLSGYAYTWNVRNWGIVLLVLGVLLFAAGACALLGMGWARALGIGLAILTAIAGFLFLAFTPVWGIIIVAVSVFAIWGLLHDGAESRAMM